MKGGGGEWEGGYEGAEAFGERGLLNFGGRKHYFEIRDCIFLVWSLGGLLQGCIGCWEFWARGPGILMESWS
jgi:hypothetical protein